MERSAVVGGDENSRDSGVCSDLDNISNDVPPAFSCILRARHAKEGSIRRSVSFKLDDDINALKITEGEKLDGLKMTGDGVGGHVKWTDVRESMDVDGEKTLLFDTNEEKFQSMKEGGCTVAIDSDQRFPLIDLANLESKGAPLMPMAETPKSHRSAFQRFFSVRCSPLVSGAAILFGRKKGSSTPTVAPCRPTSEDGKNCCGRSMEGSTSVDITFTDELDMSMCDASSVFSGSTSVLADVPAPQNGRIFFRPITQSKCFFRRTQSEQESSEYKRETSEGIRKARPFSIDESFLLATTELCAVPEVITRKRSQAQPLWDDSAHVKKAKSGEGRRSVKFTRVQSSSVLEKGEHCKAGVDNLPTFLEVEYSLETVSNPRVDSSAFKSISAETLFGLLTNFDDFITRFLLIDCRYPYEYNGGHIKGAINMHDPTLVADIFYPIDAANFAEVSRRIPIFYCEFSQKRGPMMAYALRAFDRKRNEDRYPEVDYKEMYIVDNGYKNFFQFSRFKGFCEPDAYVSMVDSQHTEELRSFSLHRSKSSCSIDCTVSKRRRIPPRPRRERYNQVAKSLVLLDTIASSPQEEESPTQFPGRVGLRTAGDATDGVLKPLAKLNF